MKTALLSFVGLISLGGLLSPQAQSQTQPQALSNTAPQRAPLSANEPNGLASDHRASPIHLSAGKSVIVPLGNGLNRVSIANPEIADITLIRSRELYIVGKKSGATNIFLWTTAGKMTVIDVIVAIDTTSVALKLKELMPNETQIEVRSAGEAIVLTGQVADAVKVHRAMTIAEQHSGKKVINLMSVGEVPQVMLEVKVAEVSKKLTEKLGAQFTSSGARGTFNYALIGNFLTGGALSTINGIGAGAVLSKGSEQLKLEAEIKNGLIKVLAEPNIIAVSGQEGAFLAGGKIFIPVPRVDGSGTVVTLVEKEYGVGLTFLPTVLEGGKINLRVTPEVSELSLEGSTIKSGNSTSVLPTISTRRASTTVQLMDGQSFAIGGLIKNNVTESISGLPFLSELPVLGALFRSSEFMNDRSELMFIVTPRLVNPLMQVSALPTDRFTPPSRAEFLLNGQLEGSRREPTDAPSSYTPQKDTK